MKMRPYQILEQQLVPLRRFLLKGSIRENDISGLVYYFGKISNFLTSLTYKEKIKGFKRVTINKRVLGKQERILDTSYLQYPPKGFVKNYGRLNSPGESILYATFDPMTAIYELRPVEGDLITYSTWELTSNYDLTVTPIYKVLTKDGEIFNGDSLRANAIAHEHMAKLDEELQLQLNVILDFIASCFVKEVDDTNHFDYFLSAHYANRIFWELQDGEIDAIIYPSVRQNLTLSNIAIKPEVFIENYTLKEVEESIVEKVSDNGRAWSLIGTGDSRQFENGKVIWQ